MQRKTADPKIRCPICTKGNLRMQMVRDDRYGYPGTYELLECLGCGHRFIDGHFSPATLVDMYSNYYPRSNYDLVENGPYFPKSAFSSWINGEYSSPFLWVTPGTTVLDIGCGFGESLGYLEAIGCIAHGVEADENIRRVAEKHGYKVHVGLFDADNYQKNFFDYVTMGQVIEHVTDPSSTLRGIASILKPGGVAILGTPNVSGWGSRLFGKYWISWHAPYHLHFYTSESMRILADHAGFELVSVRTITPSIWLHSQWLHLITVPPADTASIYWSMKGHWKYWQKTLRAVFGMFHHLKLNHIITRFFDMLGLGDNRLYFLRKK